MVKIKEIDATSGVGYCSDSDTDDSLPELEQASQPHAPDFLDSAQEFKQNRNEKKARKLMSKLGLRKVHGFKRVTLRKTDLLIIINQPDVYKNPAADTYVIFGQPEFKDLNEEEEEEEEEEEIPEAKEEEPTISRTPEECQAIATLDAAFKVGEDVIRENLIKIIKREHDLDLVVSHAKVTRSKAIKELKKNNYDMVNTFVDLTIGKKFRPKPDAKSDTD